MDILEDVSDRIWVPYQAALEYQKNRLEAIYEKSEAYDKIIDTLRKNEDRISEEMNVFKIHPYINIDGYLERIKANLDEIKKEIENRKNEHRIYWTLMNSEKGLHLRFCHSPQYPLFFNNTR